MFVGKKLLILGIVSALVIIGLAVEFGRHTNKTSQTRTTPSAAQPNPAFANSTNDSTANNSTSASAAPASGPAPAAPSGSFVSSLSAGPNDQEISTCNTTLGATCKIIFSKGASSVSLPAQAVATSPKQDQVASTTWSWTPGSLGLTSGSWNISAVATMNGQSSTSKFGAIFEVKP